MKIILLVLLISIIGCNRFASKAYFDEENYSHLDMIELIKLHNAARSSRSIQELEIKPSLTKAAKNHANWMSQRKILSHRGMNNSTVGSRVGIHYQYIFVGENIANGYKDPQSVMNVWMKSSGHRANILNKRYMHVGAARSGNYWCVVFASPKKIIVK